MQLRPYQVETVKALGERPRATLATSPGLGKSACVLKAIDEFEPGPTLIVCALKDAMWTWEKEIDLWLPGDDYTTYHGTPKKREDLKERIKNASYVITTPRMLPEVMAEKKKWGALVVDEAHCIHGRNTQAVKMLRKIQSNHFYWVTGSPILNKPSELWVALNIANRQEFSSYWRWVYANCKVTDNGFGQKIGGALNPEQLRKDIDPYYYAVRKQDVLDQLPPKNRYLIYCELTPTQRRIYNELEKDMLAHMDGDELLLAPNVLSVVTRLRQVLISPELLPGWEGEAESGVLTLLRSRIEEDFANGQDVAIFTPFAQAIPIIKRHLPPCNVFTIYGGKDNKQDIQDFATASSPKAILISIRSAASFNAYAASVGYFVGYDWNPPYNFQAEDRLHRIGQTRSVDIRYIVNRGTVDEHHMQILGQKAKDIDAIISPRRTL